jgi:hypothetical protein
MTKAVVLYRSILFEKEELAVARKYLPCCSSVLSLQQGDLVVARYSVLPYYQDIEADIIVQGARLLNSYRQHRFVADLGNYTEALEGLTPRTYANLEDVPENGGPFVLKGETNSRRNLWHTHMFAQDKRAAIQVAGRLMDDTMIGQQKIYVRDYIPLDSFMTGLDGVPVAREFRFFVLDGHILTGGFYWTSHSDTLTDMGIEIPKPDEVPLSFLAKVIDAVGANVRFYAMDVAKTKDGRWIVIELNDGQMAGLSDNDPEVLYHNLKVRLEGQ